MASSTVAPARPGPSGEPVSTEIRQLVVVPRDPGVSGVARVQRGGPPHVRRDVGDRRHKHNIAAMSHFTYNFNTAA